MPAALQPGRGAVDDLLDRVPLSIASRIFWLPLSAPSQTSAQPAWASPATASSVMRSTRDWIMKGTRGVARAPPRGRTPATHWGRRPKMSSANQTWSGRSGRLTRASSSATLAGRAHGVALAPDRLRAPVAVERAAAGADHVHAEVAVGLRPGRRGSARRPPGPRPGTGRRRGGARRRARRVRRTPPGPAGSA